MSKLRSHQCSMSIIIFRYLEERDDFLLADVPLVDTATMSTDLGILVRARTLERILGVVSRSSRSIE